MATTITGLAQLKSRRAQHEKQQEERNRPKADWFSIKQNETLTVRFLQELSEEAEAYNPAFGTFLGALEHVSPHDFKIRALDTQESEGRDWAQEQHLKDPKAGWRPRENFYINVAVDRGDGKPRVEIMSRNMHSQFIDDLVEEYEDSDGEGITVKTYTITRKGSGAQTTWKLKEAKGIDMPVDGLQPYNLEEYAIRKIPYEEQEAYYMRGAENAQPQFNRNDEDSYSDSSVDSTGGDGPTFKW